MKVSQSTRDPYSYQTYCKCGAPLTVAFSQGNYDGRLRWSESYRCRACGDAIEADGIGLLGDRCRQIVIAHDGSHACAISGRDRAMCVAASLRAVAEVSLERIAPIMKSIPGEIIHGTQAEMEWLVFHFNARCGNVAAVQPGSGGWSITALKNLRM